MRKRATVFLTLFLLGALPGMSEQSPSGRMPPKREIPATAGESAAVPRELVVDGKVVGQVVAPEPGEICLVCNAPVQPADIVYLVDGQRIPVHQGHCNEALRAQTQHWLDQLKLTGRTPQVPKELVVNGQLVGHLVAPEPGDMCLVCNEPIHKGDVVYLVQGQRVPIHLEACDDKFMASPQHWLAQIKPRGAFLGAQGEQRALSDAWFFVGFYILFGLIFAALCAHQALHRGRSPVGWFGVGLLLNAFGYLLLLTRPKLVVHAPAGVPRGLGKIAVTYAPQPCPMCGAANHPSATACIDCGAKLQPAMDSEVKRAGLRPN